MIDAIVVSMVSNKGDINMNKYNLSDVVSVDGVLAIISEIDTTTLNEHGYVDYLCKPLDHNETILGQSEQGVSGWVLEKDIDYRSNLIVRYSILDEDQNNSILFSSNDKVEIEQALNRFLYLGHNAYIIESEL